MKPIVEFIGYDDGAPVFVWLGERMPAGTKFYALPVLDRAPVLGSDIEVWWKRIGCMRNPGAHTGEEAARDAEIKELRAALAAPVIGRATADQQTDPAQGRWVVKTNGNSHWEPAADQQDAYTPQAGDLHRLRAVFVSEMSRDDGKIWTRISEETMRREHSADQQAGSVEAERVAFESEYPDIAQYWSDNHEGGAYTDFYWQTLWLTWKARAALDSRAQPVGETVEADDDCSCPSGSGSLRWPCPVHPPKYDEALQSAQPVAAGELPPLPKAGMGVYSENQMRAYGQQCADSRPAGGVRFNLRESRLKRYNCVPGEGMIADEYGGWVSAYQLDAMKLYTEPAATLAASTHAGNVSSGASSDASAVQATLGKFNRDDLACVADELEDMPKVINVGNVTGMGEEHHETGPALAARFIRAALASPVAAAVPDGWQIVPVHPTPKMVDATFNHDPLDGESHNRRNNRIYAAMLAAAPAPTAKGADHGN